MAKPLTVILDPGTARKRHIDGVFQDLGMAKLSRKSSPCARPLDELLAAKPRHGEQPFAGSNDPSKLDKRRRFVSK
jgi:hypothetical protein